MTRIPPPARSATRPDRRLLLPALTGAVAVIIAALALQVPGFLTTPSTSSTPSAASTPSTPSPASTRSSASSPSLIRGEAAGSLPDGVTVFDDGYPGIAKLDPGLVRALGEATTDAADDGVKLYVTSGWRSPARQNQLLRGAIAKYGSAEEAARWVATAETSPHVSGDAVDIGESDATAWLSGHGAGYGLCQIYRNEPWHYELRTDAVDHGCPATYADPTHDPRMQE